MKIKKIKKTGLVMPKVKSASSGKPAPREPEVTAKMLEHATNYLRGYCAKKINEEASKCFNENIEYFKQTVGKQFVEEFDARFNERLKTFLTQKMEVTTLAYGTSFKDIMSHVNDGWRVLDMNPAIGVFMQRVKGTGKKEPKQKEEKPAKVKPECLKCRSYTGKAEHGLYKCHCPGTCPAYNKQKKQLKIGGKK